MQSQYILFKQKAIDLRKTGKTYGEIRKIIGKPISKSTLSCWFQGLIIPAAVLKRMNRRITKKIKKAREKALIVNRVKREEYILQVRSRVNHLPPKLKDKDVAKIALAMLYFGEGSRIKRGSLMFGNSDPLLIGLFLNLLRYCYNIDESKFRCTLQGRADQNIKQLERFWFKTTKIPLLQFYKARIDPRTIGQSSKNPDYKGVCRIDYFSADVFTEIKQIINLISRAHGAVGSASLWHSEGRGFESR